MFTNGEFERIMEEYSQKQAERRKKLVKVWGILLSIVVFLIVFFLVLFPKQFESGGTVWILPTYGGMLFVVTFIGFLVSTKYNSQKPVHEFLYDEVIQKINMYEGLFLNYKAYDKEDTLFNKRGGLFTKHATVRVMRHTTGETAEHHHFNIYDCTIITSSGNSSQVHFDGVYYVLDRQINTSLQVRSNGSPRMKGVKFQRQEGFEGVKVYKEVDQSMSNIDHTLVQFVVKLTENEANKRIYLSVIDGQIHLGIWFKKHPTRKQKHITLDVLNKVATDFMGEYQMINTLSDIDSF